MATLEEKQEKWYLKLRGWVPQWWFEEEENQVAVFYAMAMVLAKLECELENHIKETYICQAEGGYLDEHGLERNLTRFINELDTTFSQRIKNITNTTSCPTLKEIVDALLDVGESTIVEDWNVGLFFNREGFYNRGDVLIDPLYNAFTIIVDKQVHAPYSFYSREYFATREDFIGQQESSEDLFNLIIETVNRSKALGTVYRLVERLE